MLFTFSDRDHWSNDLCLCIVSSYGGGSNGVPHCHIKSSERSHAKSGCQLCEIGLLSVFTFIHYSNDVCMYVCMLYYHNPAYVCFCGFQSGYTALMYSVMLNQPTILSALLRRGADPNVEVQQEVQLKYYTIEDKTKSKLKWCTSARVAAQLYTSHVRRRSRSTG